MSMYNYTPPNRGGNSISPWVWAIIGLAGVTAVIAVIAVLIVVTSDHDPASPADNGMAQNTTHQAQVGHDPAGNADPPVAPADTTSGRDQANETESANTAEVTSSTATDDGEAQNQADEEQSALEVAQLLFDQGKSTIKQGHRNAGYETARAGMEILINADVEKDRELIETFEHASHEFHVYMMMGPAERQPPENGTINPLSFEIRQIGADKPMMILNYEVEYEDGEPKIGIYVETTSGGHERQGIVTAGAPYDFIRKAMIGQFDYNLGERTGGAGN